MISSKQRTPCTRTCRTPYPRCACVCPWCPPQKSAGDSWRTCDVPCTTLQGPKSATVP
ncbi:hypothetical protein DUNSADRAFT_4597 [Dunaliella salina]|uniref:Uncharacterized protein n=1 Tax=Dunaliella salina TaxID=3046 RepID=A0ABQ7GRN0_DUNSA|nr:hypothetical protein DUNSADRAFT_4597 [Dunaliella salina]|eukprot:KAF5837270.1 hypothetical protein DUNSADRAFT_4597 [Dunaliella salina]